MSSKCPDRLPVPIWLTQHLFEHPMDVQMMSSKGSSTSSYLSVPTLFEHPIDVQMMSSDRLPVPIWVSQPYLNTPWTCKRCPQSDRLPVPIWLTQHQFEHPMDVQKMSSKCSSTCSYLTNTKPCLNTPPAWTCKWCPQRDRLPVPIWLSQHLFEHPMDVQMMSSKWSSTSSYLSVPTLFEHPMDVQQMSSKWSSTSSYLTDTTSVWTPHGRPKDVLKMFVYLFLFD